MNVLLKTFVVWVMLLAIPFQGYAAAMPLRAAQTQAGHDRAAMAGAHHHCGAHTHVGAHAGAKCCAGAACCCGSAVPVSIFAVHLPLLTGASEVIPFHPDFLPAVDLAHPERPPQRQA